MEEAETKIVLLGIRDDNRMVNPYKKFLLKYGDFGRYYNVDYMKLKL